jgi:hypothetical protein
MTIAPGMPVAGLEHKLQACYPSSTGRSVTYFTDATIEGPLRCIEIPWTIGVTQSRHEHTPIGSAREVGRTSHGEPVWTLTIHGDTIHGLFVVEDGRFVPIGDVQA